MFNFKYNLVNIIKIILSVLSMILMLRIFGTSEGADIYLLSYSIIVSWHFIPFLFVGQFIQFYNDLKVVSSESAHNFYNQTILLSATIGIILFLISFFFLNDILYFYTAGINPAKQIVLKQVLNIMIFSNIFAPIVSLCEQLFIAEKKFLESYLLSIIILLLPVATMSYMLFNGSSNIKTLAVSYSLSVFLSALFGIIYTICKIIPFRFYFKSKNFSRFIINSFTMFSGNGIFVCLLPLVINNFLVNFTNGIISCFYYSKNAIESVNAITIDYTNRSFTSELSRYIAKKDTDKIVLLIKKYIKYAPIFYFFVSCLIYIMIPFGLKIILYNINIDFNIHTFSNIFLSLVPWYVLYIFTNPFNYINTLSKKSFNVIIANSVFITVTASILFRFHNSVYCIPLSMALAQLIAFVIYLICALKYIQTIKRN